mgnify:CR=1 FL=1
MPDCDSARERVAWVCKCLGDADPAVQDAPWVKPLWEGVRMLAEALPPSIAGQASQASSDAFFDLENRLDLLSRHFEVMQRASALGVPCGVALMRSCFNVCYQATSAVTVPW